MQHNRILIISLLLLLSLISSLMLTAAQTEQDDCDSRVVFVWGEHGIVYMDFNDGSFPQVIVEEGINPVWSPDGTQIAFQTFDIYVVNVDGSDLTRLTVDEAYDSSPQWSPDGSQIVFESDRDGNSEVYLMNADGTGQTNITNHPAHDIYPSWSPDGTQITFMSDRDGDYEVFTMNADGSNLAQITFNSDFDELPVWSPDGVNIVYASLIGDEIPGVFYIPASGGTPIQIANISGDFGNFQWSNDSTSIIYLGNHRLELQPIDGSEGQTLLRLPPSGIYGVGPFDYYSGERDCIAPQESLTPTP